MQIKLLHVLRNKLDHVDKHNPYTHTRPGTNLKHRGVYLDKDTGQQTSPKEQHLHF